MERIAFIPARSGSSRLKNKNIKLLNGEPLIYWTVKSAIKSTASSTSGSALLSIEILLVS